MFLIRTPFAEMIRMDHDADPRRRRVLHDRLSDSRCTVDDHYIPPSQMKPRDHFPDQFFFGAEKTIRELVHYLVIICDFLIGNRPVFIKVSALIQMRFVIQRCIVF